MNRYSNLLLILVLIATFIITAQSIKCWVCHSDTDPKCADPFDNTTLPIKDCREVKRSHLFEEESEFDKLARKEKGRKERLKVATMCRKIRQKIHGNWRTIRDCAFFGSPGEGTGNEHHCLYRKGTYDVYLEYCTCNSKDGCNTAPTVRSNLAGLLAVSAVGLLFIRLIAYHM